MSSQTSLSLDNAADNNKKMNVWSALVFLAMVFGVGSATILVLSNQHDQNPAEVQDEATQLRATPSARRLNFSRTLMESRQLNKSSEVNFVGTRQNKTSNILNWGDRKLSPSRNNSTRRNLGTAEDDHEQEEKSIQEEIIEVLEVLDGPSPCRRVDPNMPNNEEWRTRCQEYLDEQYIQPDCSNKKEIVPRIYHSVSKGSGQTYHQLATTTQNPSFKRQHFNDHDAADFVLKYCGEDAHEALTCFAPPAYRADLFRFCAMYSQGGVYLDEDIMPFVPLEKLYSPCSVATVGHDFPWMGHKGKQMKILAGAPGAPIFKCALDQIVQNVRDRHYPETELQLTGPQMLQACYEKHSEDVAITYHDTRNAEWPFTGMRAGQKILAYEIPMSSKHFWLEGGKDPSDYTSLFQERRVYKETCTLN